MRTGFESIHHHHHRHHRHGHDPEHSVFDAASAPSARLGPRRFTQARVAVQDRR